MNFEMSRVDEKIKNERKNNLNRQNEMCLCVISGIVCFRVQIGK